MKIEQIFKNANNNHTVVFRFGNAKVFAEVFTKEEVDIIKTHIRKNNILSVSNIECTCCRPRRRQK